MATHIHRIEPAYRDRRDAGRRLAAALEHRPLAAEWFLRHHLGPATGRVDDASVFSRSRISPLCGRDHHPRRVA